MKVATCNLDPMHTFVNSMNDITRALYCQSVPNEWLIAIEWICVIHY